MNKKQGFTLAEGMIVFALIGVLTAILLPTLFMAVPEQGTLKAKKSYNTLVRSVEALVNGPYDSNPAETALESRTLAAGTGTDYNNNANRFFCNRLSDILNVRSADCTQDGVNSAITMDTCASGAGFTNVSGGRKALCAQRNSDLQVAYSTLQQNIDTVCQAYFVKDTETNKIPFNFKTADGVRWGIQLTDFSHNGSITVDGVNRASFYNVVCMCTAGDNTTCDGFIYGAGVRKDGKIVVSKALQVALDEDVTDEE